MIDLENIILKWQVWLEQGENTITVYQSDRRLLANTIKQEIRAEVERLVIYAEPNMKYDEMSKLIKRNEVLSEVLGLFK